MLKAVNYYFHLTNPEAKIVARCVFDDDNKVILVSPYQNTIEKLVESLEDGCYYFGKIWDTPNN